MSGGVRNVCRFLSDGEAGKPSGIPAGERRSASAEPARLAGREPERGASVPSMADGRGRDWPFSGQGGAAAAGYAFCRSGRGAVFPAGAGRRPGGRVKHGSVVAVFSGCPVLPVPVVAPLSGEVRQGADGRDNGRYGAGDGGISFFSGLAG